MHKDLINSAILTIKFETQSPLFINSGENYSLNPSFANNKYFSTIRGGKEVPTIPGSSIKGVFRSASEILLNSKIKNEDTKICDIFKQPCSQKEIVKNLKNKSSGKELYKLMCPVCKLFGSLKLKSRIVFDDFIAENGYKVATRTCVGIDRVSGASRKSALFDFEYIDYGEFMGKIRLNNFFNWQIKLLLEVMEEIDEGFITFGSFSTKGFGKLKVKKLDLSLRYYNTEETKLKGYTKKNFYMSKDIDGYDNVKELFKDIVINDNEIKKDNLENEIYQR